MTSDLVSRALAARPEAAARPTAAGTAMRASSAGGCARQIWYGARARRAGDPYAPNGLALDVGNAVHEAIQSGLRELGYQTEVVADWSSLGFDVSGSADAVGGDPLEVVELKTTAALGYVRKAPKPEHVLQAGIYALSPTIRAPQIRIVYIDRIRFATIEHVMPAADIVHLVLAELGRLHALSSADLPPRSIPATGIVDDPYAAEAPWNCRYCDFRQQCSEDGA